MRRVIRGLMLNFITNIVILGARFYSQRTNSCSITIVEYKSDKQIVVVTCNSSSFAVFISFKQHYSSLHPNTRRRIIVSVISVYLV